MVAAVKKNAEAFVAVLFFIYFCQAAKAYKSLNKKTVIPDSCKKSYFLRNYSNQSKPLHTNDINNLQNCSKYYPTCKSSTQEILYTYAEHPDGKFSLLVYSVNNITDGCWGSVMKVTDDLGTKTIYFNTKEKQPYYMHHIYFRLGFSYTITVQSLPAGQVLSFRTKAPTRCELEVLMNIYDRLQKGTLFKSCPTPGFTVRQVVAEKVCKLHPKNSQKRYKLVKKQLIEKDCKFVIIPKHLLKNEIRKFRTILRRKLTLIASE